MLEIRETNSGLIVAIKVIPNARTTEIVGLIGDRLKIRVAVPPESGKANDMVCGVLAGSLGVSKKNVWIVSGKSSGQKSVCIAGISQQSLLDCLDLEG